jgi:thymidine kinase
MRIVDGVPVVEGPQVLLGADEQYVAVCFAHYDRATRDAARRLDGVALPH